MKPLKLIFATLFTSAIAISGASAAERNWTYIGKNVDGIKMWVDVVEKPMSQWAEYWYRSSGQDGGPSYYQVNCKNLTERFRYSDGTYAEWSEPYDDPETMGYDVLKEVCGK